MPVTRRDFIRGGVAAFTVSFTAPAFLSDIARAQGARSRSLVVVYLGGRKRRAEHRRAVSGSVLLQPPPDDRGSGRTGPADRQRHERQGAWPASRGSPGCTASSTKAGSPSSSEPATRIRADRTFQGFDIWGTANPSTPTATGWLGRYLETVPKMRCRAGHDARSAAGTAVARRQRAGIADARGYAFASPNNAAEGLNERAAATRIASHVSVDRPHLAFVNATAAGASTRSIAWRRSPRTTARWRIRTMASPPRCARWRARSCAAPARGCTGCRPGGYDTHASQGTQGGGAYAGLMGTFGDGLAAFYTDLRNQGLLSDTLVLQFSEFGRRISENGSGGHRSWRRRRHDGDGRRRAGRHLRYRGVTQS